MGAILCISDIVWFLAGPFMSTQNLVSAPIPNYDNRKKMSLDIAKLSCLD